MKRRQPTAKDARLRAPARCINGWRSPRSTAGGGAIPVAVTKPHKTKYTAAAACTRFSHHRCKENLCPHKPHWRRKFSSSFLRPPLKSSPPNSRNVAIHALLYRRSQTFSTLCVRTAIRLRLRRARKSTFYATSAPYPLSIWRFSFTPSHPVMARCSNQNASMGRHSSNGSSVWFDRYPQGVNMQPSRPSTARRGLIDPLGGGPGPKVCWVCRAGARERQMYGPGSAQPSNLTVCRSGPPTLLQSRIEQDLPQ